MSVFEYLTAFSVDGGPKQRAFTSFVGLEWTSSDTVMQTEEERHTYVTIQPHREHVRLRETQSEQM